MGLPAAALQDLRSRLGEVADLEAAVSLAFWDQHTMMPTGGAGARADQLATLSRLAHERFCDEVLGEALDALERDAAELAPDGDEASLLRVTRRRYNRARRVPSELAAELARAGANGQAAWARAKTESDFSILAPWLTRHLELKRDYVACFTDGATVVAADDRYDVLLDDFDEGLRVRDIEPVFAVVRERVVPLVAAIAERAAADPDPPRLPAGPYDVARQRALAREMVASLGFDDRRWRVDPTLHPFECSLATSDVRIATRLVPESPEGIFFTLHECGHGLYDAGAAPALERTPLRVCRSCTLQESQSRLWENLVGRSRPFWRHWRDRAAAAFPEQLGGLDAEGVYRAVNVVAPTLVRGGADELTYCLHIVLRFELERELVAGTLAVADLPAAWNECMRSYLGLEVPDDARGVLQDVHWSEGAFGYFPTYLLGNALASQLWARADSELDDLDEALARGDATPLHDWLSEHLYRHGGSFTLGEALARVLGGPLDPEPFLDHLEGKYGEIYGLRR